jgi:hypothetical protein
MDPTLYIQKFGIFAITSTLITTAALYIYRSLPPSQKPASVSLEHPSPLAQSDFCTFFFHFFFHPVFVQPISQKKDARLGDHHHLDCVVCSCVTNEVLRYTRCLIYGYSRADPSPNTPSPGAVYNAGAQCPIAWGVDSTGLWKTMNIQLMTGSNLAMVPLTSAFTYIVA